MTNNVSAVWDDAYNRSMWVEIYNASATTPYALSSFYFTDDLLVPRKWQPAYKVVGVKNFGIVWFENDAQAGHANFKLDPEGGKLYLLNSNLAVIDSVKYPAQYRNISYGRITDGAQQWVFFDQYSPAVTNNNKKWYSIRSASPVFNLKAGFYSGNQNLSFATPAPGDTIYYTLDGVEPTVSSLKYLPNRTIPLTKTTVVRAKIFSNSRHASNIVSATYFINERNFKLPVVSIITEPANLTDNTIGIYVQGSNGITGNGMNSPANWNQDWDRPVNFELFDTTKVSKLNQELDITIAGGWTRMNPQKSLKINPKKKFGNSQLDYDIFKATKPNQKYKSILLRNSGNDFYYSMLRDGFMNSLVAKRMNLDYIAYEPAVCFMNGVYYGIQNLRERSDVDYIFSNYGYDEDEIKLVETWELPNDTAYTKVGSYLSNNDITQNSVYQKACEMIDIESFTNYYMSQIYYGNTDWPENNIKAWKPISNGKWRWILYDTDFGYNLYNTSLHTHNSLLYALGELAEKIPPAWSTLLLRRLILNETYKKYFVSNFCIHISSTFESARSNQVLDSLAAKIRTEIAYHKTKWPSNRDFNADISNMKTFSNARPANMLSYISNRLMNGATVKSIAINSNIPIAKYDFNGIQIPDNKINMRYFANQNVTLKARKVPGYKFTQWDLVSTTISGQTLIPNGSTLKYFDGNATPTNSWNAPDYIDTDWKSGSAPLGYGGRGEVTTLSYGSDVNNKNTTAYFRNTFNISGLNSKSNFIVNTTHDDGIVVYINGVEIGRENLPEGLINFNTLALTYSADNGTKASFSIPKNLLVEGKNVIAFEVHQNSITSSDLLLNFSMTCDVIASSTTVNTAEFTANSNTFNSATAIYEIENLPDPDAGLQVLINEIVSSNTLISDEFGGKDDYIELYNAGENAVNIAGWYLTDTPTTRKLVQIPTTDSTKTQLPAKGRLIVWADGQPEQGVLHVNFKLSKDGETIILSKNNYLEKLVMVDSVTFPVFEPNLSYSRVPDGSANWVVQKTTHNASNTIISGLIPEKTSNYSIYPSSFKHQLTIQNANNQHYRITDTLGKTHSEGFCNSDLELINTSLITQGLYFITINNQTFKLIKL